MSSCMVELLRSHLLCFSLIKNINPIAVYHCQSWQRLLFSRGSRNMKYPHLAAEIFSACHLPVK